MPSGFTLELIGISPITERLSKWIERSPQVTAQAMYTSALAILVPAIKKEIEENYSVFRGQLHQRISARVTITSATEAGLEVGAIGVPYSLNVEEGAPPHEPNDDTILEYVRKKLGVKGKKLGKKGGYDVSASDYALARAIVETIKRKGTLPHPFLIPAWEKTREAWLTDTVKRLVVFFEGK